MIALFVSISGVAWAAATIGTDDIKNGAVTADKLHSNAVTNPKIKNAAVNGAKLQNNAVTNPKIALGAVSSSKLQNNAVTNPKIGLGAVSAQKLQNNAVTNAKLQDNAVSSGKIQDNAVNGAKIASGSVGTDELGAVVTRTNSISVPANSARQVSKSCDPGELALSAGANWNGAATVGPVLQAATYVSGTPEPTTGTAAGRNNGGGARTLTVIVSCLQP
jgi:hypothetical protein